MPARTTPPPRGVFRKLERVMVGAIMTVIAFALERMVMRSLRKEGRPKPTPSSTITSKGGEFDLEPD